MVDDEFERIAKTYEVFDEEHRLSHSAAAKVEFITTMKSIEKYLKPKTRILDIGAGTGSYSLPLAEMGYVVDAVELSARNIAVFQTKIKPSHQLRLVQGNALDLSRYESDSFDLVLVFGPLYHLSKIEDRKRCIQEAKRVCKKDGLIYFAFISNDMVMLTETLYNPHHFGGDSYNHDTFKVHNFPFVFSTVDEARNLLVDEKIIIIHEVASDGMSELLPDTINKMDQKAYQQYLRFYFYACEKPDLFGYSNHLLFIGKK